MDGVLNFPVLPVYTNGTGTGTHLGEFSFKQNTALNVVTATTTGSTHWVAANGDTTPSANRNSARPKAAAILTSTRGLAVILLSLVHGAITCANDTSGVICVGST